MRLNQKAGCDWSKLSVFHKVPMQLTINLIVLYSGMERQNLEFKVISGSALYGERWCLIGQCLESAMRCLWLEWMHIYLGVWVTNRLVRRMACCGNETNENVERHSIDRIDHLFCEFLSGVVYCDDPCHCCAPSLSTVSSVVECCSGDHHWLEHLWINSCNANLQSSVYNLPIRHATRME